MTHYAQLIRAAIVDGGWTVPAGSVPGGDVPLVLGTPATTGVTVWVKDPKTLSPAAIALKETFEAANLNPHVDKGQLPSADEILIVVIGSKPF